ncbi:hypothetical protein [Mongoliitalea daihaiensis]|uniref:hypothetical protein n=1 Tax=Mongoliitalea daihaiensis TaxID=2782006 RepID=UPI001F39A0F3|nr:hypothetical protein [Mongoliitalea daihaiensis]UJP64892.1 hypothetical protein IPZ59_19215 [Mongoliitalea daihaiensis]
MKLLLASLVFSIVCLSAKAQQSNLIIEGKNPTSLYLDGFSESEGKLSSGEVIKVVCFGGGCNLNIEYKGRIVLAQLIDSFDTIRVSEYDFADDGDFQLIVEVILNDSNYLMIFRYGSGMIQKLFEKEIGYYKTIVKKNYIEYYMPSYLEAVWHYYNGGFFQLCSN